MKRKLAVLIVFAMVVTSMPFYAFAAEDGSSEPVSTEAADEVKENDIIEIRFGSRVGRYQITDVREVVRKENAAEMYRVLQEDEEMLRERS